MDSILPFLVLVGLLVLLPVVWLIANYNRFARLRHHIRESWSDIDVELKRRYELIPNLVETVRGYANHEQEVLQQVTALRQKAISEEGSPDRRGAAEASLQVAVRRLLLLAEDYPQLRADQHFLALQDELTNTEDRIAAARRFFNGNIREMNQLCESFPTSLVASFFGFQPRGYFQLESDSERSVPQGQFERPGGR